MFKKILIANRGEIAVRIIRACREMGISTVAVYSEADSNALHVQMADEAICIGGPKARDSYLNMYNILTAACKTKSGAIHPGFGFLAENSTFAHMCKECGIKFIGPPNEVIARMGDKQAAKDAMKQARVPVIPGSDGIVESVEEVISFAKEYTLPIVIKAAAGGGGKGIRIVRDMNKISDSYFAAKNEAKAAFGDDRVYVEKFIDHAKHIEVQILADSFGHVVHLGERDCSVQRQNQKLLEEAPAFRLNAKDRSALGKAAVAAAKAVDYENCGTVEFLYDKKGKFYFMEMNTRIQVEHPVTEMVTGVDIVKEQIKIAAGEKLSFTQSDIQINGHSIECRINAENPDKNFTPSCGTISYMFTPDGFGIRVDSAAYTGYAIPPYYDSMIAKLIVHGRNRQEAIAKMKRALTEFVIEGVESNIDFQTNILDSDIFVRGLCDTRFIAKHLSKLVKN